MIQKKKTTDCPQCDGVAVIEGTRIRCRFCGLNAEHKQSTGATFDYPKTEPDQSTARSSVNASQPPYEDREPARAADDTPFIPPIDNRRKKSPSRENVTARTSTRRRRKPDADLHDLQQRLLEKFRGFGVTWNPVVGCIRTGVVIAVILSVFVGLGCFYVNICNENSMVKPGIIHFLDEQELLVKDNRLVDEGELEAAIFLPTGTSDLPIIELIDDTPVTPVPIRREWTREDQTSFFDEQPADVSLDHVSLLERVMHDTYKDRREPKPIDEESSVASL